MSAVLWPSCIITRCNCISSVSVTSGTSPTSPSACFSASVKAVDLLSDGSRSNSIPCLAVLVILITSLSFFFSSGPGDPVPQSGSGGRHVGCDHFFWVDNSIEFGLGHEAELQRGLLQRKVIVHSVVRNLGSLVVANDGRERCYQHQRTLDVFVDLLQIGLRPLDQELTEVRATVGHERDRVRNVVDDQRFVDIHFEITPSATEAHS